MILDSTARSYRVVLTAARTTNDMSVIVEWEPISKMPTLTPTLVRTSTDGTTAVDILTTTDLPKRITSLTIYNKDTAAKTVQVFLLDAGDSYLIVNAELQPGETLGYSEATQWYTGGQVAAYALLNGSATETFSVANATADAHAMPKLQIESLFAPLASPTLTGTPAAPTATAGTNTTQLATTAFVTTAVAGVDIGAAIHAATNKATPVGADEAGIWDSVSGLLNRISFTNLAAYFSGLCTAGWNAATATALSGTASNKLPDIDVTQATGALTVALNTAIYQDFHSATVTDGTPDTILCDPADLIIPDGATLGSTTTVAADIAILMINNAGTAEFAVKNITGTGDLAERGVISTTAIGTGSDSADVFYSTTARTNVAYKVVKMFRAVNTAGTWGDPSLVNGGGLADIAVALHAYGAAPMYAGRGFFAFNGSTAGTNAPLAGGNVTSVTRTSTGKYIINIASAMPDALYGIVAMGSGSNVRNASFIVFDTSAGPNTTTTAYIKCFDDQSTLVDETFICGYIFR